MKNRIVIFEVVKGSYQNEDCERKLLNYVLNNSNKTGRSLVSVKNVLYHSFDGLVAQFENVNRLYCNEGRRLWHFVVSVKKIGIIDDMDTLELAKEVMSKFEGHQMVAAVHLDNPNTFHAHIVMSHINVLTGKRLSVPYSFFKNVEYEINAFAEQKFA